MTKHVIYIAFTMNKPPEWWVKARTHMFLNGTYKSIFQQKEQLGEMPDIWLFCGEHNRHLTDDIDWPEGIRLVYDNGKSAWAETMDSSPDHIAVTRIDSDDMYHKDALKHVYSETENRKEDRAVALSFHQWYVWMQQEDKLYNLTYKPYYPQTITKVLPKCDIKDYDRFLKIIKTYHGPDLKGITNRIYSLPKYMLLSVRGELNVSYLWCERDIMNALDPSPIDIKPSDIFVDFGIDESYKVQTKPNAKT